MYYRLELSRTTGDELKAAFEGIPDSVTTLNLESNNLRNRTGDELKAAFEGIPKTVNTLGLSGNYFSTEQLIIILKELPTTVEKTKIVNNPCDHQQLLPILAARRKTDASQNTPLSLYKLGIFTHIKDHEKTDSSQESLPDPIPQDIKNMTLALISGSD
jgi:hypothetical protein